MFCCFVVSFACLFVRLSICLPADLLFVSFANLFVCFVDLFVDLLVDLFVDLFVDLLVGLFVCLFVSFVRSFVRSLFL